MAAFSVDRREFVTIETEKGQYIIIADRKIVHLTGGKVKVETNLPKEVREVLDLMAGVKENEKKKHDSLSRKTTGGTQLNIRPEKPGPKEQKKQPVSITATKTAVRRKPETEAKKQKKPALKKKTVQNPVKKTGNKTSTASKVKTVSFLKKPAAVKTKKDGKKPVKEDYVRPEPGPEPRKEI